MLSGSATARASAADRRKIFDKFIAVTGYHENSAIRALNTEHTSQGRQTRVRPPLYDGAARAALIVLWEASDRVCGKRLRALLPILLPAMERNQHLKLDEPMRQKILSMSASTIDRLLRVSVRTFAGWNDPSPGSMEMDLVAHCGEVNSGSYINSLITRVFCGN